MKNVILKLVIPVIGKQNSREGHLCKYLGLYRRISNRIEIRKRGGSADESANYG